MAKFTDPATVRAITRYYNAQSGQVSRTYDDTCIMLYYKDWLSRRITVMDFNGLAGDKEFIKILVEEELSDG